jgi:hypothetical protein
MSDMYVPIAEVVLQSMESRAGDMRPGVRVTEEPYRLV